MKYLLLITLLASPLAQAECLGEYQRKFYPHWKSHPIYADTRQAAIARAMVTDMVVENRKVVAGLWYDPFTGQNYRLRDVKPDADHLASLAWVHERGGACMTRDQRRAIANDPDNIWIVHPSSNRQKGARVSTWLPANLGMCTKYLRQLKIVVDKYNLKLTTSDISTYNTAVGKCKELRNGILIKKQKTWFKRWLGGLVRDQ